MKRFRLVGFLIIAAHWLAAVWHLFIVARIPPVADNKVSWLAVGLVTLFHFVISVAWWKLSDRFAGSVLLVFFVVVTGAGTYEHFLGPGPNNIFRLAPGDWTVAFQMSVFLLVSFEILGLWLAIRFLKGRRSHASHDLRQTAI